MAGDYTFNVCSLVTGEVREELPLTDSSWTRLLKDDGDGNANVALAQCTREIRRSIVAATDPWRSTVLVVRDKTPLGEWVITGRPDRANTGEPFQLECKEITAYLKRVIFKVTGPYVDEDQLKIAWDLIAACANPMTPWSYKNATIVPEGGKGMAMALPSRSSQVSGVLRDRTYNQNQMAYCGDLLTDLSNVTNGFDFDIDVSFDTNGNLKRVPRLSYPRRGTNKNIVLEQPTPGPEQRGGNVTAFTQSDDGSQVAVVLIAFGAGTDDEQIMASTVNTDLVGVYPVLHQTSSYTSVELRTTLQEHADADAAAARSSKMPPTLTLLADKEPVIGTLTCGDTVRLAIEESINFPTGVSDELRITGITYTPPVAGPETYQVTVALVAD